MFLKLLKILFLLCFSTIYCQESVAYLSEAIKANLNYYQKASEIAFARKDFTEGQHLFDSLVQYHLLGTEFDNFTIKGYHAKNLTLNKINKPIFIITYTSWCLLNKGEIAGLNRLAKEHRDKIVFIVLFWDKKSNLKKIANQFSNDIEICHANNRYKNDLKIFFMLKNTLGFPISYFIDENKKVLHIKRISNQLKPRTPFVVAKEACYANFNQSIIESIQIKIVAH
jgi:thiol-disulfide isomerase/thioredoxin